MLQSNLLSALKESTNIKISKLWFTKGYFDFFLERKRAWRRGGCCKSAKWRKKVQNMFLPYQVLFSKFIFQINNFSHYSPFHRIAYPTIPIYVREDFEDIYLLKLALYRIAYRFMQSVILLWLLTMRSTSRLSNRKLDIRLFILKPTITSISIYRSSR